MLSYGHSERNGRGMAAELVNQDQAQAISFYVAASDRAVLAKVSDILRGQGYIGIADTSGQIRYIVDGRSNLYSSAHQIRKIAEASMIDKGLGRDTDEELLRQSVEAVLHRKRIPKNLKGYQLLRFILILAAKDETILRPVNKILYPRTAEHFKISCHQVDRIIRYATKQAKIEAGNASLISCLRDEVVDYYNCLMRDIDERYA